MVRRRLLPSLVLALLLSACGVETGNQAAERADDTAAPTTTRSAEPGPTTTTRVPLARNAADEVLVKAADKTIAVRSFNVLSTLSLTSKDHQHVMTSVKGRLDLSTGVGQLQVANVSRSLNGNVTVQADGTTLWIKPSERRGLELPAGTTWVATSADVLGTDHAFDAPSLLGALLAVHGSAGAEVGPDGDGDGEDQVIDGVRCTRYATRFNYEDALRALGPDASILRHALDLWSPVPPDLRVSAWIGPDGVIREFHLKVIDDTDFDLRGTLDLALRTGLAPDPVPEAPPADEVLSGPQADRIAQQILG